MALKLPSKAWLQTKIFATLKSQSNLLRHMDPAIPLLLIAWYDNYRCNHLLLSFTLLKQKKTNRETQRAHHGQGIT